MKTHLVISVIFLILSACASNSKESNAYLKDCHNQERDNESECQLIDINPAL